MTMAVARIVNTTPTAVAAGENIPFTSNQFTDTFIQHTSEGIKIKLPGVYKLTANFDATNSDAGMATVYLQENGVKVAGAAASANVAAGETTNLGFSALLNVKANCCNSEYATITFVNQNAITYNVANVIIERICG